MKIEYRVARARYLLVLDPRIQEFSDPNSTKSRELERLVQYQLSWQEIGEILDCPGHILERAWQIGRQQLPPFQQAKLMRLIRQGTYQRTASRPLPPQSSNDRQVIVARGVTDPADVIQFDDYDIERWPEHDWEAMAIEQFHAEFEPSVLRHNFFKYNVSHCGFVRKDRGTLKAAVLEQIKASDSTTSSSGHVDESLIDWQAVHETLDKKYSPSVCMRAWKRWYGKSTSYKPMDWTEDEMITYWRHYIRVGKNWDEIAKHLATRTADDCRSYFYPLAKMTVELGPEFERKVLKGMPSDIKLPKFFYGNLSWTPELDERLIQLYSEATANQPQGYITEASKFWKTISERLDAGASPWHCEERFTALQQPKEKLIRKAPLRTRKMTDGEMTKLAQLVQELNPFGAAAWRRIQEEHLPNHPWRTLWTTWGRMQQGMILNKPEGREFLERTVLKYGDHRWQDVADELTKWLYRDRPDGVRSPLTEGGARLSQRMARSLWAQLWRHRRPFWQSSELKQLEEAVGQVVGKSDRPVTIDEWMEIGRHVEHKDSLQCRTMWEKLKASPETVQEELEAQPVFEYLWLHGKLPSKKARKQWEKEHPGIPLRVPAFFEEALAQRPAPNIGWTSSWDRLLQMTVDRYDPSFAHYYRLGEILGTSPVDVSKAWRRLRRSRSRQVARTKITHSEE
ncbi:hypothetical protein BGW42_001089 [Actinomortierella wolfii]|nr:hypothetical protein BGW42_001089 [Actinomortierella wolfii]